MTSTVAASKSGRASPLVWGVLIGVGLLLVLLAVSSQNSTNLGGRADPRGSGPQGLLAARLFVEEAGGSTELDVYVPSEDIDIAILSIDQNNFFDVDDLPVEPNNDGTEPDDDQDNDGEITIIESWEPLLRWVGDGGILITEQDVPGGPGGTGGFENLPEGSLVGPGTCTIGEYAGINNVAPMSYEPIEAQNANSCFGEQSEALIAATTVGNGQIVRIATLEPFFNGSLGEADNAALFARSIRIDEAPRVGFLPEAPIRFIERENGQFDLDGANENAAEGSSDGSRGDPANQGGSGDGGLFDLLPPSVIAFLIGLVAAVVLFAIAKSRRLGSPVEEEVPIDLPSSSFVDALGRLYRRAEKPNERSADIMRQSLRKNLTRRAGMPSDASAKDISTALAGGGEQRAALEQLLDGPAPESDDALVELAQDLAETRNRIEHRGLASFQGSEQTPSHLKGSSQ